MASGSNLVSQPLSAPSNFNWVLLIELLVCGILAIFFLGYLDRLFATLISYGIRAYTWRNYHAYIDIQALQLSLLGGRIFFKDLRYHAHNETITVHSGYITWNYWYRKVRDAQVYTENGQPGGKKGSENSSTRSRTPSLGRAESGGAQAKSNLPCRITIHLEGVQAFLYNRSPVYDSIIDHIEKATDPNPSGSIHQERKASSTSFDAFKSAGSAINNLETRFRSSKKSDEHQRPGYPGDNRDKYIARKDISPQKPKLPSFLQLFPILVRCKTAAAVLGNENTRSIITVKVDNASGTFDAGHAGPFDVYKLLFDFDFEHPVIRIRPNVDFKELQLTMAVSLKKETLMEPSKKAAKKKSKRKAWSNVLPFSLKRNRSIDSVRAASFARGSKGNPLHVPSTVPGQERWQGLSRYMDDDLNDGHDEWDAVEYAKATTIADCPRIGMTFYWDIPGPVPETAEILDEKLESDDEDINGSAPPEYGLDLQIYGGNIVYGPWADRQRANFQSIFFPGSYADTIPAKKLSPGEPRVSTVFKLFLSVEEETTLRIPVREPSKDWRWKGRAELVTGKKQDGADGRKGKNRGKRKPFWRSRDKGASGANVRPFAWLDVKILADSSINYTMDMVARPTGFKSEVSADVRGLEIYSSVNHGLLWRSGSLTLDCDTSVPLGWNALREWKFKIINDDLELYILRDHLFLLTDVISDWSSGPLAEYFTFTPFRYLLDVTFRNFKLFLNTNDSNIINDPADLDKNQFVILYGRDLHGDVIIPLEKFRPVRNEIFFDVVTHDLGLQLLLSPANTVAAFVGPKTILQLDEVTLRGSHAYYSETSSELTDRLTFNIHGSKMKLFLFGFVVDRLIKLKENYFGEDLHFRTLEEFQEVSRGKSLGAETDAKAQQVNRSNDLDVILIISADDVRALLPANMYSADESIAIDLPYASADLRLNNYYMDLQVDFSPMTVSHNMTTKSKGKSHTSTSRTEIFIEAATLCGHRVFGLPPLEPTYLCIWDVDVGKISGECSSTFVELFSRAIQCFAFSLDDDENSMPLVAPVIIHDITFLRVRTQMVKVWLHIESDALLISAAPASVDLNDWAGSRFSHQLKVSAPDLTVSCVDANSASRHRTRTGEHAPVETHAFFRTSLSVTMLRRQLHFRDKRQKQQDHLLEQDTRTHRTPFLHLDQNGRSSTLVLPKAAHDPPAMIYPSIPDPIPDGGVSSADSASFRPPLHHVKSKTSLSSSLGSSLPSSGKSQLLKRSSRTSLAASIRRKPSSILRPQSAAPETVAEEDPPNREYYVLLDDQERKQRGLAPSSVAFSSPLAAPYFPLHVVEPDPSDLPSIPLGSAWQFDTTRQDFNDTVEQNLDEDIAHTSLILALEPGIQCFMKPKSVTAIANLVEHLLPKTPESLLDSFQISVMGRLLGLEKLKKGAGNSIEVSLRIPAIAARFLNTFEGPERNGEPQIEIDQYDLEVAQLALTGRYTVHPVAAEKDNVTLVHGTVDSLAVSVKEKPLLHGPQELGIRAQIDDILFWMASASKTSVNLSFRDFEIATASRKIEYLAGIGHRTLHLANDFATKFVGQQAKTKKRLRYLAYSLTMASTDVSDPPFLTRSSHVLRVSPHHLRNHDSWKIISRLRYVYQGMSEEARQNLKTSCVQGYALCPENAQKIVTNNWDQWRSWDLAHVKKSYAMQDLYDLPDETSGPLGTSASPTEVSIRSSAIQMILDPGSTQTDFTIDLLTINLVISPPSAPSGLMLLPTDGEQPRESILVEVSSRAIALRVNWEIIDLVETAIELASKGTILQTVEKDLHHQSSDLQTSQDGNWRDVQAVIVVGHAGVEINTPNINALAASKSLRLSLVSTDKSSTSDGLFLSALLHAKSARSEFHSHDRLLVTLEAELPNLYLSRDTPGKSSSCREEWRVAGTCKDIIMESKEEILGIIEAVDLLVRHEATLLQVKFANIMMPNLSRESSTSTLTPEAFPKVTVALLMDAYRIQVALLPTLKYSLSGTVGRVSVSPNLHMLLSLDVDVDINGHSHELISHDHKDRHVISALHMPPINGQVKVHRTSERLDLSVTAIIESIVLEASSVHGLLSTLNQPEVSDTLKAITADVETLKQNIQHTFPPSEVQSPTSPILDTTPGPTVAYDVALTLAGIQIKADAPGKLPDAGTARLFVGINCLQLNACNLTADKANILPIPEIHAQLRQFFIELRISDRKGTRSCGNLTLSAQAHITLRSMRLGQPKRQYRAKVDGIVVNLFAETASAVVDVLNHLQDRIKDMDFSREKKYVQRLRQPSRKSSIFLKESVYSDSSTSSGLFTSAFSVALMDIQISWIVGNSVTAFPNCEPEDLVLSIRMIDLSSRSENSSTLMIQDLQLQTVPIRQVDKTKRSLNSALLPEMKFHVGYTSSDEERKMSFQAAGKSLEVLLDSKFMLPVNILQRSIGLAVDKFREATASWEMAPTDTGAQRKNPFGDKRLSSLLVDADFAGAIVRLQGQGRVENGSSKTSSGSNYEPHRGRYGQFLGEDNSGGATLTTPGLALKVEYKDTGQDSSLNAELNVSGSSNTLTPTLVPLILEISDSIKTIVGDSDTTLAKVESKPQAPLIDEGLLTTDPSKLLGGTRFNLGVRICRQEFSLSCQPIARVAASAHVEDIYITANSVKAGEHDHFISVSANLENIQASIQHIYSRESTFSFEVQSIVLTMMNSKHLSGTAGLSAALRIYPMRTQINARQLQDFLLFREIWVPPEIRGSRAASPNTTTEPQDYLVARYQQVTTAAAFPWTATVSIAEMKVELDLGQAIGKSTLLVDDLWASSRKDSSWEQNLCIGIGKVGIESSGRMSGFVELSGVKVRTMIAWPQHADGYRQTPTIQASAGFERLRLKAAFDYQAFAIADISSFDFLMYNVRPDNAKDKDRLVTLLDGDKVNVFCTAQSASQSVALFQAFERLVQENRSAYEASLKEIEKFLRRQSAIIPTRLEPKVPEECKQKEKDSEKDDTMLMTPISLYTDVVVTLKSINVGAFPSAFFDNQIFLIEASDVQARFAATLDGGKIHSGLGMTLGQLQVALTTVAQPTGPKTLQEITVHDVVNTVALSRGGTILRVPKVIASMQTWQAPASYQIDYVFKSRFEGKVDVGWNYSRISFIRGMYNTHARNLASRLGKPLPESAVKITTSEAGARSDPPTSASGTMNPPSSNAALTEAEKEKDKEKQGEKITAVVNVPQSKYTYTPLEPAIIETPQLRDMGEATPPLEWIGLHRDRLPNVTHQIVIVALLGVAKEVEDAYGRILGNT